MLRGRSIPVRGGILLSLEKINRILELDEENLMVTVEPSVFTRDMHDFVEKRRLLYSPDPGPKSGTIDRDISTNGGGMWIVKYGVTRDFVQELEVVVPSGEVAHLSEKTRAQRTVTLPR